MKLVVAWAALLVCAHAQVLDLARSPQARVKPVPVSAVSMQDGFWSARRDINRKVSIPSLLTQLEDHGILDNFRRLTGKKNVPRRGPLYTDSDLYKWMEAAAYEPEWQSRLDPIIAEVAAAQEPSGYINTYYSAERLAERHTNMRHGHELYCGGHLIQAGIAHYRATGSRKLLDIGVRFADYLIANFGPAKKPIIEGHPEIELALVELYRTTGERKYLDFAGYMLKGETERIPLPQRDLVYLFSGKPFTSRTQFEGHSVRAMYAASGATDYYLETGDATYRKTLDTLWNDLLAGKLYITGGVGSRSSGEAFGEPFELPNQLAYTESCAAIANMFWNWRMLATTGDSRYSDLVERALYNGVNSGLSLSGDLYCYRNPLELSGFPEDKIRNPWYDTTCCPPNLQRVLSSLPGYLYGFSDDGVYVHLYHSSTLDHSGVKLVTRTEYPWKGDISIRFEAATTKALYVRIPAWSANSRVNGKSAQPGQYLKLAGPWKAGDTVSLQLDVSARTTAAHPRVRDNVGKVAIERGPLVYCAEGVDQTLPLWDTEIALNAPIVDTFRKDLLGGVVALKAKGVVRETGPELYAPLRKSQGKATELTLVPYYTFANRGATPMQVWLPYQR